MKKYFFIYILIGLAFAGCEDVIEITPEFEGEKLVVDAWLDNLDRTQTVRLTYSQPYFENEFADAVTDATVQVIKNGDQTIEFESDGQGNFTWVPENGQTLGQVGDEFELIINFENNTFRSETEIYRVPEIDSIAQVFEEEQLGFPEGIYAEIVADDFEGIGDTYWIKTWKNGQLLNKPFEILLVYDATFDAGSGLDGVTFIFPIRRGINPIPEDVEEGEELPPPYTSGDEIYVEIQSISNDAHRFMQIALEQMTNGDNGIFALPIANTRSNIISDAGERPLGFFNVAAVNTESTVIR